MTRFPAKSSRNAAIRILTAGDACCAAIFAGSIPTGCTTISTGTPALSTPRGVDSKPRMRVQLLTKCRA